MAPVTVAIPIVIPKMRMRSNREQHEDFGVVPLIESPSQILQDTKMINDCFFGIDAQTASPLFKRRISNELLTDPEEHSGLISSNNDYSPLIRTDISNISSPFDWEQQWSPYEPNANSEGGALGEIHGGVHKEQKEHCGQQTIDSSIYARGEGTDSLQWNSRRDSFEVYPVSSSRNEEEMIVAAMNNDKNAETAMTPNPEMDSDSSWIEKWMDMNGIFDPNCDHLASDIDLPLLCEVNVANRSNDNASNNSTNITDSNDKNDDYHDDSNADQIIPTNTVYSQKTHGSPQQTNLMTMINTPPSSNDTIRMNFDQANHSPATVQCSPSSMVLDSHEIINSDTKSPVGWNYGTETVDKNEVNSSLIPPHHHILSATTDCKTIANTRNADVGRKSSNNTKTYVLRPAPKATVRLISQMPLNEQNRRSAKVIKASCNVRNKKLHSYPYLHDSSEDEPYLSSDDNIADHSGYVRSASRSSQKSASSEFARTTGSPISRRSPSTSPHISERKREQNRSAAIRYRDKRREEAKRKKQELHDLELKNVELKTQVAGLSKEISYLKTILHEVLDKPTN